MTQALEMQRLLSLDNPRVRGRGGRGTEAQLRFFRESNRSGEEELVAWVFRPAVGPRGSEAWFH